MNSIRIVMASISVMWPMMHRCFVIFLSFPMVILRFIDRWLKVLDIFIIGAQSIARNWTQLTVFHDDLLTVCRPVYFNYGFNEEFIELIDTEQTIRYNRSAILVKHIRSTTHLFCKLYLDTACVGVRVQILIKKSSLATCH